MVPPLKIPSFMRNIANQLTAHDYKAKLFIISNGIDPHFSYLKTKKPAKLQNRGVILVIGRRAESL